MNKRFVMPVLVLVLGFCAWRVSQRHNRATMEMIEEAERGVPSWESGKFSGVAAAVASNYAAALVALEADEYSRAYTLAYYEGKNAIEGWAASYGTNEVSAGVTVREFAEGLHASYRDALRPAYDRAIERVKAGDLALGVLTDMAAWHHDMPELRRKFDAEKQEIENARVRAAGRWVRLVVWSDFMFPEYQDLFREKMLAKRGGTPGVKFVTGYSTGYREDEATFKIVEVRLESTHARYEVEGRGTRAAQWSPPPVPESCTVTFTTRSARAVSSTWDDLPPIRVEKIAPDTIKADEADAISEAQAIALFEMVRAKMESLPEFDLHPDVDPSKVQIMKGGRLDPDAFRVLEFKDPGRLDQQLRTVLGSQDSRVQGDLMVALIERGDDRYAPWITPRLRGMKPEVIERISDALVVNPAFGDYEPVLAVVRQSAAYPHDVVNALRSHVTVPKVATALLEQIKKAPPDQRINYMNVYLGGVSTSAFASCAIWLREKDENFARSAYYGMLNRDSDLANRIAVQEFDRLLPALQQEVVRRYPFRTDKAEAGVAFYRKAAGRPELRRETVQALMQMASATPKGWDLLAELAAKEGDPGERQRMEERLMWQVGRAHPERAEAYYLEALRTERGGLRDAAINQLLEMDGPKDDRVRQIRALMGGVEVDPALTRQVLMSVHQYISIRKGWNFEQPELLDLIAMGAASRDARVRGFAYGIMAEGVKQGAAGFEADLEQLLAQETDEKVKREGQQRLEWAKRK